MAWLLTAEDHDWEYDHYDFIAIFSTEEKAEQGRRDMERIRSRLRSMDVTGLIRFFGNDFARGKLEFSEIFHRPHPPGMNLEEAHKDALIIWHNRVLPLIGHIPYRWFDTCLDYEIYEVNNGLVFPNGMEPALSSEVEHDDRT